MNIAMTRCHRKRGFWPISQQIRKKTQVSRRLSKSYRLETNLERAYAFHRGRLAVASLLLLFERGPGLLHRIALKSFLIARENAWG